MATTRPLLTLLLRRSTFLTQVSSQRCMSDKVSPTSPCPPVQPSPPDVPGLSKRVVDVPCEPVGPGAAKNTNYKNPEYFCYNTVSYFEAEVEMAKYRLSQPSSKTPLK